MPVLDGFGALASLRAWASGNIPAVPPVKVVAMVAGSSFSIAQAEMKQLRAFDGYLAKPVRMQLLAEAMEQHVGVMPWEKEGGKGVLDGRAEGAVGRLGMVKGHLWGRGVR
jgi:hypothetical protein